MKKEILVIILLFGMLSLNCTIASTKQVNQINKIEISDITLDNIYKIQSKIELNQFSEKEILVDNTM